MPYAAVPYCRVTALRAKTGLAFWHQDPRGICGQTFGTSDLAVERQRLCGLVQSARELLMQPADQFAELVGLASRHLASRAVATSPAHQPHEA